MTAIVPEERRLHALDGAELILTRLRGGPKGPLLVVHGAGVASTMFTAPSLREPFAPFLARHGWDVWLLDWRASIRLPFRQLTLDEAAENDFPAAVRAILAETRAPSIMALPHCVGSIAFFLSLGKGLLPEVRSVLASQVALHYRVPPPTEAKTALHVPELLEAAGLEALSAHEERAHPLYQAALDAMLDRTHPECESRVCHRVTFMFGLLYVHRNLSAELHDRVLGQLFGRCNLTTYRHLAQLVRHGSLRSFDFGAEENRRRYGRDEPPGALLADRLRMPIALVSGEHNRTFLPAGTEETYDWLCAQNGRERYRRRVTAGYGHIDNYLGERSDAETYPTYLELLEEQRAMTEAGAGCL